MSRYHWIAALVLMLAAFLFTFGCGAPATPPTPPTPPSPPAATPSTPPVTTPPTATPPSAETGLAGALAAEGKTLYADSCARCHGADAEGSAKSPALVGSKAALGKFGTAQALFDYESKQMPLGAGGSLSKTAYNRLLAFILVQNGYVQPSTEINFGQLDTIKLTAK